MVEIGGFQGLSVKSFLLMGLILAFSGCASANPSIYPEASTPLNGINELFMGNLAVDMLLFSVVFLLLLWKLKSPMWFRPKTQDMLVAMVLLAGIAVAVTGAVVDFYCLYEEAPGGYWPVMSTENVILGGIGVFATIYIISFVIAGLRILPSLVQASLMAAFSVLVWMARNEATVIAADDSRIIAFAFTAFLLLPPVIFRIKHVQTKKEVHA